MLPACFFFPGAVCASGYHSIEAPGTFEDKGQLRIGAVESPASIREGYVATGSLYLRATGRLELGLPAEDPFWTEPDPSWTQKCTRSSENIARPCNREVELGGGAANYSRICPVPVI